MKQQYIKAAKVLMEYCGCNENEIEERMGNSDRLIVYYTDEIKDYGVYADDASILSDEQMRRELWFTKDEYEDRLYLDDHMNAVKIFYYENDLDFEQFESDFEKGNIYIDRDFNPCLCMFDEDNQLIALDLNTLRYIKK